MKFLDDILMQSTGSTPAAPANNNFGILYASASRLQYCNASSNATLGYPSNSGVNIIYYTGSGNSTTSTYTWTKPPGCNFVRIFALGPGGGGGSGANRTTSGVSAGGCGGGGGAIVWAQFLARDLPDSVTVTVPGCSPGGAGQSTANTSGRQGTSATSSYTAFGNFVSASGGNGGFGGTNSGVAVQGPLGGLISTCRPYTILPFGGCPGGSVSNLGIGSNATFQGGGNTGVFLPNIGGGGSQLGFTSGGGNGGGAGGGRQSGITVFATGGSGSGGFEYNVVKIGSTPGTINISPNGADGQHNYIEGYLQIATGSVIEPYAPGQGGAGGVFPNGLGGNGGLYGAGGGGGSISTSSGVASGAGGSGSAGLCVVIEYL